MENNYKNNHIGKNVSQKIELKLIREKFANCVLIISNGHLMTLF